jgi:uncharacterized protein YukE
MADVVSVNFASLQAGAAALSAKASALNNYVEELQQNLQPMVNTWVASGSSAGQAAQASEQRLQQATNEIIQIIQQFSGKVTDAHDLQLGLENKNVSYFA